MRPRRDTLHYIGHQTKRQYLRGIVPMHLNVRHGAHNIHRHARMCPFFMAPRWTLKWPDDSKMFALSIRKLFTVPLLSLLQPPSSQKMKLLPPPPTPVISLILCHHKHYGCYFQLLKGWYWHRQTHTKCCMYLFFPSFAEVFSLLLNLQTQYDVDWVLSHHSFGGFNTKQ